MKKILGLLGVVAAAGTASAQISNVAVSSNVSADGTKVANVFAIDFSGQYTGSQLLVNLTSGSIINETLFGASVDTPPSAGALGFVPALAFDTYVANGALTSDGAGHVNGLNVGGGAVNLGGVGTPVFNDALAISQAWNPAAGVFVLDRTNFVTAQLGLTSDANGTIRYLASANQQISIFDEFEIVNGVVVPEPATAALLGLGGLAMLRRRSA